MSIMVILLAVPWTQQAHFMQSMSKSRQSRKPMVADRFLYQHHHHHHCHHHHHHRHLHHHETCPVHTWTEVSIHQYHPVCVAGLGALAATVKVPVTRVFQIVCDKNAVFAICCEKMPTCHWELWKEQNTIPIANTLSEWRHFHMSSVTAPCVKDGLNELSFASSTIAIFIHIIFS